MWKDMNALTGSTRRRRLVITAVVAGMAAFMVSYMFAVADLNDMLRTGLVSDVNTYRDLAEAMLGGALPYIDFPFEHLPSMLIPIVGLGWLSSISGVSLMLIWPLTMTGVFAVTAVLVDRIDPERPSGFTFIAISVPLLPLSLFRLEPWVVVFAVGAMAAFLAGRTVLGVVATVFGSLAKGWPIVVSVLPWKMGDRVASSLAVFGSGLGLAVVVAHEGFRAGRDFDGIHTETLVGSIVVLGRHFSGSALGTFSAAGARYVAVPSWTLAVNAIPGVVVLALAIVVLRRPLTPRSTVSLIGFVVLGIVLVSPLFSTQFLVWIAPFVAALSLTNRRLYVIASALAVASVAVFAPTSLLWSIEVLASNLVVLALAVSWGREFIADGRYGRPASTSLRNLPV